MALLTTTIGAFPKPNYVKTKDWFSFGTTLGTEATIAANRGQLDQDEVLDRAVREVVAAQVEAGIDIPTDGEVRRENYVHYHCRHLSGIDFSLLTERVLRSGAWIGEVPTFTDRIEAAKPFLPRDWRVAQAATERPVKVTMPGPLTIMDTTADRFYFDDRAWGADLADALNAEATAVAAAGCTVIQLDEPVFARYPAKTLDFGIELLERVFAGLDDVTKTMHMCCGYPDKINHSSYEKADPGAYHAVAGALDQSCLDVISLEDAHRHNSLDLFEHFSTTTVALGSVQIAQSRIETVDEIIARVEKVLDHIDGTRLMLAPDCGLGMLPRAIADAKLRNLCAAAQQLGADT